MDDSLRPVVNNKREQEFLEFAANRKGYTDGREWFDAGWNAAVAACLPFIEGRSNHSEMVKEFHKGAKQPVGGSWHTASRRDLRVELIYEEWLEYERAEGNNDFVEVADALADLLYVIHGAALEYDIPLDAIFAEVHRSNMSKLGPDGNPLIREDGKILKPDTWTPPDIEGVLEKHGIKFPKNGRTE